MGRNQINASVIGWYGKGNVGDEAYKIAFPSVFGDVDFSFTDEKVAANTPVTILGGGDVVTSDSLARLKRSSGRKFVMSVTISQDYPASAYEGIERIFVRDQSSINRLSKAGVRAELIPDFAFSLRPDPVRGAFLIREMFSAESLDLYSKVVVVVVNAHLTSSPSARQAATFEKFSHELAHVADHTSASFLFVPFGTKFPWDDRTSNGWIAAKCKFWKKNCMMYSRPDPQTALDIIAASDAAVSTRLHSSIFSTLAGVPFVDVTHNHKNPHFLKSVGLGDWGIPLAGFEADRCKEALDLHLSDNASKKRVTLIGEAQTARLRKVSEDVCLHQ